MAVHKSIEGVHQATNNHPSTCQIISANDICWRHRGHGLTKWHANYKIMILRMWDYATEHEMSAMAWYYAYMTDVVC